VYELTWINSIPLILAGTASGFINTLAGGGSFLTLPALMLLGMPADLANGTNRVSVLAQSASTVQGFYKEGKFDTKAALWILAPSALGALAGAWTAALIPAGYLKPMLLGIMLIVAAVIVIKPQWISPPPDERTYTVRERPIAFFWFFLTGIYAGFIQAGVGFLSLMVLGGVLRYDLLRANALKIAISGMFGIVPLIVFALAGKVLWIPGAVLGAATVVGSRIGVRFALRAPERVLRWFLFAAVICVTVAAFLKK